MAYASTHYENVCKIKKVREWSHEIEALTSHISNLNLLTSCTQSSQICLWGVLLERHV